MSNKLSSQSASKASDPQPNIEFDEYGHDISQFLTSLQRVILRLSRSSDYVDNCSYANEVSTDEEETTCEQ